MKFDKGFIKEFLKISFPMMISQLLANLVNMTDTVMLGTLSEKAISGVSVANRTFFIYSLHAFLRSPSRLADFLSIFFRGSLYLFVFLQFPGVPPRPHKALELPGMTSELLILAVYSFHQNVLYMLF